MSLIRQRRIWDGNWEEVRRSGPSRILGSRFAREAYGCISSFVRPGDRLILEAGCGTGRLSNLLAADGRERSVVGIDISPNSITVSNLIKRYLGIKNIFFGLGDLFRMPFPDETFDLVFNEGVIEHYAPSGDMSCQDALCEMIRVTKKGGRVLAAVPNWYNLPHTFYKWALRLLKKEFVYGYEKSFKHSELRGLFEKSGLKEIEMGGFFPAHGLYRLAGEGPRRYFNCLGAGLDRVQSVADRLGKGLFSRAFGFEIIIKGVKPRY